MHTKPNLNRRTKIIATLGPSSANHDTLKAMFHAGVNLIRLNASHVTESNMLAEKVKLVRAAAKDAKSVVGIMLDLQGPKIRIGKIANDKVEVASGDHITITTDEVLGTAERVSVSYRGFSNDVKPGELLFIDDGKIHLSVQSISGPDVKCKVLQGGILSNHKGLNLPHTEVGLSALTEKDISDAKVGVLSEVDYIALSFVSKAEDVHYLRRLLGEYGGHRVRIIAKIERQLAMQNLSEIIEAADAVMVARGDLGVEIELPNVPKAQKMIINEANKQLKPVIVATQMLESMIQQLSATRAEVSDVANAIYDQCDAVMLSGETAVGIDPVNVIQTMARICEATDNHMVTLKKENPHAHRPILHPTTAVSICKAADQIAEENDASTIMAFTSSGNTPLIASKLNPIMPIVAPTDDKAVCQRMSLYKGVIPMMMPRPFKDIHRWTDMIHLAVQEAIHLSLVQADEMVVVTAGIPIGQSNGINSIRVITA
ncbi:pyruvate kinase [bacterium]|nr:pyruvate kinase [bacterium]